MHLLVIGFAYDDDATIERELLGPGDTIEYFRRGQSHLLTAASREAAEDRPSRHPERPLPSTASASSAGATVTSTASSCSPPPRRTPRSGMTSS